MRTEPPGQRGLSSLGQAQALPRAQEEAVQAQTADPRPSPQTVTSHSLTLATRAFRLDFTWRRVETDPPPARPAIAGTAAEASAGDRAAVQYDRLARTSSPAPDRRPQAAAPPRPPRQSFAEVLRRQQLAGLVLMPSRPPADRQALAAPMAHADPQPGPVCRAYAEALGPLGAETSRFYTV